MNVKSFFTKRAALGILVAGSLFFASCGKDDVKPNPNGLGNDEALQTYSISANASGDQVVPTVMGTGSSTFNGTYNAMTNTLTYKVDYADLTGAPSSGGFYLGGAGDPGTQVGSNWTMTSGGTGTGSYSGTMTLTNEQAADLLRGDWYYQLGTSMNSTGEVRGQLSSAR